MGQRWNWEEETSLREVIREADRVFDIKRQRGERRKPGYFAYVHECFSNMGYTRTEGAVKAKVYALERSRSQPPHPYPGPLPSPEPSPYPGPLPLPEPSPYPGPLPLPEPSPYPGPLPSPEPSPYPGPLPFPEPSPYPGPLPIPEPSPYPGPLPFPQPSPYPGPLPFPQPSPYPGPLPFPQPSPDPGPKPKPKLNPITIQPEGQRTRDKGNRHRSVFARLTTRQFNRLTIYYQNVERCKGKEKQKELQNFMQSYDADVFAFCETYWPDNYVPMVPSGFNCAMVGRHSDNSKTTVHDRMKARGAQGSHSEREVHCALHFCQQGCSPQDGMPEWKLLRP